MPYHQTNGSPVSDSRILFLLPRLDDLLSHPTPPALLEALPRNQILSHHQRPVNQPFAGFVTLDTMKFLLWGWHRLLREAEDAPSLETFTARPDRALSSLVWLKMFQLIAGRLDKMVCKGLFQPKPLLDSKAAQDSFSSKSCKSCGIGSSCKSALPDVNYTCLSPLKTPNRQPRHVQNDSGCS